MSPEPVQPHSNEEQTWDSPNLSIEVRTDHPNHLLQLSDNEDEHALLTTGYLPLAQEPTDSDSIIDDNDDDDDDDDEDVEDDNEIMDHDHEWTLSAINTNSQSLPPPPPLEPVKFDDDSNRSSIHLDTEKINQVKSIMANFKLPTDNHPPWANTISEDQWKKQLFDRIKHDNNL
ncbi:hypothetical protein PV325_004255 [Microctonus aethiopoides]|uniref:Male-enhanced antigen 1 n=1 Tax=Microctonus aethiopoides TaxID=144406 RepID=A0AA39KYA2_9HYME|nr:hypothetical protein PV326_012028 [Microctonus aethiopoides]KAK0077225.1 hypothetical protein PV325_004255 [Microctonus aethiopoides]KAK0178195.1 hypothetical protein PV328_002169 [Microctonus aethiopoides]